MQFRQSYARLFIPLQLLGWLPLILLLPLAGAAAAWAKQTPPNVVVILVDDLGYGDLACYGAEDMRTPAIDQLMAAGLRFDRFYANCPVCSPTRAALLSGRYPELVGVPGVIRTHPEDSWGYLDPQATLLPNLLQTAGYQTAIVGKWHLGLEAPNRPNDRGFEHFHGYLGDMMDDYYKHRRHGINYMRLNDREIDPSGHATDLFTQWAIDYLERRQDSDRPFFLYLAYNAPHTPIQPPADWLAKVKQREPKMTDRRAKLVALIEHLDHGVGQVMQTLKKTGLAEKTLVIFTSDNGGQVEVGANNGPWRDGKQSMYQGGLLVPGCAVWPGHIRPAGRTDAAVLTMDLLPTLCELAGVDLAGTPVDGRSILPTLLGQPQQLPERDLFFHRREGNARYQGLTIQAVISGEWKLLQNSPFAPLELYHLAADPQETRNLAQTDRQRFNQLSALLRRQIQRGGSIPWQPPARRESP